MIVHNNIFHNISQHESRFDEMEVKLNELEKIIRNINQLIEKDFNTFQNKETKLTKNNNEIHVPQPRTTKNVVP